MTNPPTGHERPWPDPAYSWYVVAVISFAYVFAFIDRIIVGLLTPAIQADLGLSDTQAGLLQGLAFALFYTLFGLPLGLLADRKNRKVLLTIGMTVWSGMTAVCGLAVGFWPLFLARIGVGVGEATLNPCASSLIGDYFPPKTRPKAFGVYVMATAFGTALTYIMGGVVIGMLQRYQSIDIPLLGPMKPWQLTFIAVGLPGLIPALLFVFTVKEPVRRDTAVAGRAAGADIRKFLAANRATLFYHHAGIALILAAIYGFINWMPTYFLRIHGWTPPQFSLYYGIFGGACGVISALSSGWLATKLRDRGYVDGTMRACVIGGVGVAVGAIISPLMPTPELALAAYCLTGIFVNYPSVLGLSAITEIAPNEMRAFITSIYVLIVGLISATVGPFAVGFTTDAVFADRQMIGWSLVVVSAVTGIGGTLLLALGLKSYRTSLARAVWSQG